MYQLAIFDLDGTLLDTLADLRQGLNYALSTQGFAPRTLPEVRAFVGNGIRKLIERAVPAGTDEAQIEAVFEAFNPYYAVHCADFTTPYPGISELLRQLQADGVVSAVVSNKPDYAVKTLSAQYFPGLLAASAGAKDGVRKSPARTPCSRSSGSWEPRRCAPSTSAIPRSTWPRPGTRACPAFQSAGASATGMCSSTREPKPSVTVWTRSTVRCGRAEARMERKNNYEIQAGQARKLFCAHDLDAVARAHGLRTDGDFLYLRLLSEDYRVSRADGYIARRDSGAWLPADGFDETLTIFDLLCDAKPGRRAAGAWKTTLDFGGQVHRGLMEPNRADALELLYDRRPELLERACLRLGGTPMAGADVSFSLPFFEELRIAVQFWHGDDEFAPRLRVLWDANADQYLRYETMYYAIGLLKSRLREYGGE